MGKNMEEEKLRQSLFDTMRMFGEQAVKTADTPNVIECQVLSLEDPIRKIYKVQYLGNKFLAYGNYMDEYCPDENVFVLIYRGDFSKSKLILGRAEAVNKKPTVKIPNTKIKCISREQIDAVFAAFPPLPTSKEEEGQAAESEGGTQNG